MKRIYSANGSASASYSERRHRDGEKSGESEETVGIVGRPRYIAENARRLRGARSGETSRELDDRFSPIFGATLSGPLRGAPRLLELQARVGGSGRLLVARSWIAPGLVDEYMVYVYLGFYVSSLRF